MRLAFGDTARDSGGGSEGSDKPARGSRGLKAIAGEPTAGEVGEGSEDHKEATEGKDAGSGSGGAEAGRG